MMNEEYIKLTQEWHRKGFESRQAEVDELQKRIDKIEGLVFGLDGDNDQYNLILCINGVKKILKGKEND